jgi:hypothetical protein
LIAALTLVGVIVLLALLGKADAIPAVVSVWAATTALLTLLVASNRGSDQRNSE